LNILRKILFTSFLISGLVSVELHASEIIKLGLPVKQDNNLFKALRDIHTEAFSRFGKQVEIVPCVPYYCGVLVRNGELDGEAARHGDYSALYPQLSRVDFILFQLSSIAITRPGSDNFASMGEVYKRHNRIAYQIGYRGYEERLKRLVSQQQHLVSVNHWSEGIDKVRNGEADAYLGMKQVILKDTSTNNLDGLSMHALNDFKINVYPFLGKKILAYKKPLLAALTEMQRSRKISSIFSQYQIPLE